MLNALWKKDGCHILLVFLKQMEYNGIVGHSGVVAINADGDGDFHPEFKTIACRFVNPSIGELAKQPPEFLYDAG